MNNAIFSFKEPVNEPAMTFLKGSKERMLLEKELQRQSNLEIRG